MSPRKEGIPSMNTVLSLTDLDPLANLLGDWSKTLNTGSAIFRVAMVVILAAVIAASAPASAILQVLEPLYLFRSLLLRQCF